MGYEDIRTALARAFSLSTLNEISRLAHDMLNADVPVRHPSAAYALAATSQKIAWYWEGHPVRDDTVAVIEAHIRPRMEAVIAAADGDPAALIVTLDDLARSYVDALPFLKSIES